MKIILFYNFKSILFLCLFSLIGTSCGSNLEKNDKYTIDEWISDNKGWAVKQYGSSKDDNGQCISNDSSGNVYVTGLTRGGLNGQSNIGDGQNGYIMKLNSALSQQWTTQFKSITINSPSSVNAHMEASSCATDSSGSIYFTGTTTGILEEGWDVDGGNAGFIIKYNSLGIKQWIKMLGSSTENAMAVTTDSSDNVLVVGNARGNLDNVTSTGSKDLFVVKYNSSGTRLWTKLFGESDNTTSGKGVSTDSSDNIYAVGTRGSTYPDGYVVKINSSGNELWSNTFTSEGSSPTEDVSGVTVDKDMNVYVSGATDANLNGNVNAGGSGYDAFLIKYNSSGIRQWTKQFGTSGADYSSSVVLDSSGNIYVTGNTNGNLNGQTNSGSTDSFIIKFNSSGTMLWTSLLGTPQDDKFHSIIIDSFNGLIFLTGTTTGGFNGEVNSGGEDIFIVRKLNY